MACSVVAAASVVATDAEVLDLAADADQQEVLARLTVLEEQGLSLALEQAVDMELYQLSLLLDTRTFCAP